MIKNTGRPSAAKDEPGTTGDAAPLEKPRRDSDGAPLTGSLTSDFDLLEGVIEEFTQRQRRGENPSADEYAARYPEFAERVRDLLNTVAAIERSKVGQGHTAGGHTSLRGVRLERLGDFRIVREIGRGGMGIVYEAEQESLGRRVAVKVLPKQALLEERHLTRFQCEARTAARLHHSNIVPVLGVGEHEGYHYYVMQLIDGTGLDRYVDARADADHGGNVQVNQGDVDGKPSQSSASADDASAPANSPAADSETRPVDARELAHIGMQAAEALRYAHQRGVLHRDVKPANLILDSQGTVWVTDFGLAKALDQKALTRSRDMVGTLTYMAPEQLTDTRGDARSDVYSLGITLYELATGRAAFDDLPQARVIEKIAHGEVARPRQLNPALPLDFETTILKAIARQPQDRYQSAGEFAEDLGRFLEGKPPLARRMSVAGRAWRWCLRHKTLAASAAAIVVLVAAIVVGLVITSHWFWRTGERLQALAEQRQHEARRALASEEEMRVNLYNSHMKLSGEVMVMPGGLDRLMDLTDRWNPTPQRDDLRNWEWYFLRSLCHRERLSFKPPALAWSADWRPDGRQFVASFSKGQIRVWDAVGGSQLATLSTPDGDHVYSVRWGPDGKCVAASGRRGIWVFDVDAELMVVQIADAHEKAVRRVNWSPDGSRLASASHDGTVKIWDSRTGRLVTRVDGHDELVNVVAWSPDGRRIAAAGEDEGMISLWNADTGALIRRMHRHFGAVRSLGWSPDGQRFVSAGCDRTVRLWDKEGSEQWCHHMKHAVLCTDWHPDGQLLVAGSSAGAVDLIDMGGRGQVGTLYGHAEPVWDVRFRPDGAQIVSACINGEVKVWDTAVPDEPRALPHDSGFERVSWSPDGSWLAAAARGEITIVAARSGRTQSWFRHSNGGVFSLSWSPDATRLATAGPRATPTVWNASTGQPIFELAPPQTRSLVDWSPDGALLAWAQDKVVHLCRATDGRTIRQLGAHDHLVQSLDWSPDSTHVASADDHGQITVFDAQRGEAACELNGHAAAVSCVRWCPDGKRLASSSDDHTIRVWDVATGETLHVLKGHALRVTGVCWNHDGSRLATAGRDHFVRIWDASTGVETLTLAGHEALVCGVDWSHDGMRLASASWDGSLRIWDATRGYQAHRPATSKAGR